MLKKILNKKGVIDPVSLFVITIAGFAVLGTTATYALGGKELAKKNGQSIWAHMIGACAEGSTDSRCIMK